MKKVLSIFLLVALAAALFSLHRFTEADYFRLFHIGGQVDELQPQTSAAAVSSDPTLSMNRLRIVLTTTSDWSRLTVPSGDSIVNHTKKVVSGSSLLSVQKAYITLSQNEVGSSTAAEFEVLLSTDGLSSGVWQLARGTSGTTTHIDIYNINDKSNPVLIGSWDKNDNTSQAASFTISGEAESAGGPLSIGSIGPKKVFANYVPWWSYSSWDSPTKNDRPTTLYSVRVKLDVERIVESAASNGIDGFITSYQGDYYDGVPWRILRDVANQRPDFTFAAFLETSVANSGHTPSQPTDAAYMRQWITEIVNSYGAEPSYLKVNGKPVIFIYRARVMTPDLWESQVFDPLRAQGIDAFYMADYVAWDHTATVPEYLAVFDGMHSFNPSVYASISDSSINICLTNNSQATKTYSLLDDTSAERKLWMGTVVPGFDGRLIYGNDSTYIPRDEGNFYRSIWDTNLSTNPDWIMVTTWNDYGENTHLESSVNYGNTYLDMTKSYADAFKRVETSEDLSIAGLETGTFLPAGFEATWQTNRPADSELFYGPSSGNYNERIAIESSSEDHGLVATGLHSGKYFARAKSTDSAGTFVVSPEFEVIIPDEAAPRLTVDQDNVYWSDYVSYLERTLSVDLRITNLGPGDVNAIEVTAAYASGGVSGGTPLPLAAGSVASGNTSIVTVKWYVPESISSFDMQLRARALTAQGTRLFYPNPSIDQDL